ncbi:hypothetical protein EDD29_4736 [Actinocorallia herbida]|uniref:Neocarzinostatin family protein n=1 Tax=Actinocorallia herbida TaxID=58109 RepID=A0A3N1D0V0_9ACTN|nr:hypothetical protein [Actinocorallia herbida]ROO87144.1 hypothetical protein EDD29_4736 [Actinocorallia herbida]
MKAHLKVGTTAVAALTVVAMTATAALATTTVRRDTSGGAAYSGNYQILNVGPMTVTASGFSASCTGADLRGTLTSAGAGTLATANVTGCTSPFGAATVTFQGLPATGTLTYAPVAGGRDASLTFTKAANPNFKVKAVMGLLTCYYGFGTTVTSLTFNVFNGTNANRPIPASTQLQGAMQNASLDKLSGSSLLCPSGAVANANGEARGEVTAGSGVFNQKLYVGP